ncbi:MAG: EI24 domain-containing protein [Nitrospinae bacterium]|nr:EI24 domain-containing protein [Nitrospinota bacterium]
MTPIRSALHVHSGAFCMFKGARLIFTDWRLFRLALTPFALNTALFIGFLLSFNYVAYHVSSHVFAQSNQEWYWAAFSILIGSALFAVSILIVAFGFASVGLILSAPFNDILSAAVEEKLAGKVVTRQTPAWGFIKSTIINETKKMSLVLFIQLSLFLMNLVPGVGQVAFVVLSAMFISFVMAYEFTGYTLDRRGFSFAQKRMFIVSRFGLAMGFGALAGAISLVPVVNFLLMPVSVAGGTILAVENDPASALDDKRSQT